MKVSRNIFGVTVEFSGEKDDIESLVGRIVIVACEAAEKMRREGLHSLRSDYAELAIEFDRLDK